MPSTFELMIRTKKENVRDIYVFFEYFEGMTAIRTPKPEVGEYANLQMLVSDDFKEEFNLLLERLKERAPWTLIN